MEAAKQTTGKPHVVMFPVSAMGHVIPMAQFAKLLASKWDFSVTFVTIPGPTPDSVLVKLWEHPGIISISLPPPDLSDLAPGTKLETIIAVSIKRSLEPLQHQLLSMQPISAMLLDLFCVDALDVAKDLGIPAYLFFSVNATFLSFMLYLPILDKRTPGEYKGMVMTPGNPPFKVSDVHGLLQDRQNEGYKSLLHIACRFREFAGIVFNSFDALEPNATKALLDGREYEGDVPPVYPVGPLVKAPEPNAVDDRDASLEWLDRQPRGSVLFVSFGSIWTVTQEQVTELALGLEASGQRFLWVVRRPHDSTATAPVNFARVEEKDLGAFLPEGFRERTSEVGLVVPQWALQAQILSHEAVGGFLSHCGWNSTLETIVYAVPMIGWPLLAEQRMNAQMLADEIGISVTVDFDNETGLVPRQEVERVVRMLMEGETAERLRKRVAEVKAAAAKAISEEGSSYQSLARLAPILGSFSHLSGSGAGGQESLGSNHI